MEAEVRPAEQSALPEGSATSQISTSSPSTPAGDELFRRLSTYPFSADPDFKSGLASILGTVDATNGSREEVEGRQDTILQAQCFYFARKYNLPQIDFVAYKSWMRTHSSSPNDLITTNSPSNLNPSQATQLPASTTTKPPEPPYPNSFAHIVDLITNNKPIPGIEDIPDTILAAGSSPPNKTPQRRKPWEKEGDDEDDTGEGGAGGRVVIRMLQPITTSEMPETETDLGVKSEEGT